MTINVDQAAGYIGQTLYGSDGKIGKIGQLYLDDETRQPEWVTVSTGLFGTKESFVPLAGATPGQDGLTVPYEKSLIKDAPRVDLDSDQHLSPEEEDRLYAHYGFGDNTSGVATGQLSGDRDGDGDVDSDDQSMAAKVKDKLPGGNDGGNDGDRDDDRVDVTGMRTQTAATTTTGTTTSGDSRLSGDDAMTRSEERLNVDTEQRVAGRARLRKYIETEHQSVEVPVRRERLRVETEPITEGNRGEAVSGADMTEAEHEVTLTEERPVVTTETVPVERVRVSKEIQEDTETVSGEVRKERIDLDTDDEVRRRS